MFIEYRYTHTYRPYGTKEGRNTFNYKHIVPTGLKKIPKLFFNLHLVCATKCPNNYMLYHKFKLSVSVHVFSKDVL